MQVTVDADTLAEKVRVLRFISGLTLPGVADRLEEEYGYAASRETVRRVEAGTIPADKIDPLLAAYLADIFGVAIDEFCPEAAEKLRLTVAHLERIGGLPEPVAKTGSRSTPRDAARRAHPSGGGAYTTPDPFATSGDRSPLSVAA